MSVRSSACASAAGIPIALGEPSKESVGGDRFFGELCAVWPGSQPVSRSRLAVAGASVSGTSSSPSSTSWIFSPRFPIRSVEVRISFDVGLRLPEMRAELFHALVEQAHILQQQRHILLDVRPPARASAHP